MDILNARDEKRSKKPKVAEHIETLQLFYEGEENTIKISFALLPKEKNTLV